MGYKMSALPLFVSAQYIYDYFICRIDIYRCSYVAYATQRLCTENVLVWSLRADAVCSHTNMILVYGNVCINTFLRVKLHILYYIYTATQMYLSLNVTMFLP